MYRFCVKIAFPILIGPKVEKWWEGEKGEKMKSALALLLAATLLPLATSQNYYSIEVQQGGAAVRINVLEQDIRDGDQGLAPVQRGPPAGAHAVGLHLLLRANVDGPGAWVVDSHVLEGNVRNEPGARARVDFDLSRLGRVLHPHVPEGNIPHARKMRAR